MKSLGVLLLVGLLLVGCRKTESTAEHLDRVYTAAMRMETAVDMAAVEEPSDESLRELEAAREDLRLSKTRATEAGAAMKDIMREQRDGKAEIKRQQAEMWKDITGEDPK